MKIFSDSEKHQIRVKVREIMQNPYNEKENRVLEDLLASLQILHKILEEKWYKKAGEGLEVITSKDSKVGTIPPITNYLGSKLPEKYIRIISFAVFLKSLLGRTNVMSKLREYTKKGKYSEVTTDLFDSTYLELKTASYFIRNGLDVEFLKEGKSPTPDMRISCRGGNIIVECKKKRFNEQYSTNGVLDSIRKANSQLESFKQNGIVAVEISLKHNDSVSHFSIEPAVLNELKSMKRISGVLFLVESTYEEGDWTGIKTNSMYVENTNAITKPPQEILTILQNTKPPPQESLLDD